MTPTELLKGFLWPLQKHWNMEIEICISLLDCHNKMPQTRLLKQQKFIFSWFWRLEIQDQDIGKFGFSWSFYPGLADGHRLSVSSSDLFFVCGCPRYFFYILIIFPYKNTSLLGLGSACMTFFNLNYFFKGLISQNSHVLRLEFQHMIFAGYNSDDNDILTPVTQI